MSIRNHFAATLSGIALLLVVGDAAAVSYCTRTYNELDQCDITPVLANGWACVENGRPCTQEEEDDGTCDAGSEPEYNRSNLYPWEDVEKYRDWLYNDPPGDEDVYDLGYASLLKACEKFYAKQKMGNGMLYPGEVDVFIDLDGAPPYNYGICLIDAGWDQPNDNDDSPTDYGAAVHVDYLVERDPECDRIPHGPYANNPRLGVGGSTPGAPYKSTQTAKVREENARQVAAYLSPFKSGGAMWSDGGTWRRFTTLDGRADGLDYYKSLVYSPHFPRANSAEVDHIIPAKDSHGCGCGTNSYANAALISRTLNSEMSNSMRDPARRELLRMWTSAPAN